MPTLAGENAAGQAQPLSLQQALERARTENAQLAAQRARRSQADALKTQTRQGFLPTVSADASYLRFDASLLDDIPTLDSLFPPVLSRRDLGPVDGHVFGVQVVQPLVNVAAWNARRQADAQVDAARRVLTRAEDELALGVVEAYFGARTAGRQVAAEQRGLATAQQALEQAEGAFREGLVAPVDVLSARSRVAEMKARIALAESRVTAAEAQLGLLIGLDAAPDFELVDPVPEPRRRIRERADIPEAELMEERADLRAAEAQLLATEYAVGRARAAFIPDLSLLGRYQRVDGDQPLSFSETGWLVGLTLRWTPFAGFAQAGKLDEAQAREQEARAELSDLRRRARVEARSAHAEWRAQLAGWDQAKAAVADAAEVLDQTFGRYAEGLDDITDLLRAQAEDLAARTREINARFNALIAAERYHLAIGAGPATERQR
ncbi:MAG: TolC family protein [Wenzhouxiangella sp.]